jgi:hypothetical protein
MFQHMRTAHRVVGVVAQLASRYLLPMVVLFFSFHVLGSVNAAPADFYDDGGGGYQSFYESFYEDSVIDP